MMSEFRFINLLGATGRIRREQLNGRTHVVVPVVALVEGAVRAMNAKGYEMVRADKFGKAPGGWNGRPIFAGHPVDGRTPISGNDPRVLERSFGQVFNAAVDDRQRLCMEAWIDEEKAKSDPASNRVLERVLAHERGDADAAPLEVSVGALVGLKDESGTWRDKAWRGAWDLIMPDHLALLAENQVGACSVAMGCGALRAAILTDDGIVSLEGEAEIVSALKGPDMQNLAMDSPEFLKLLRDIPQAERDSASDKDFAGPNRSFPILAPRDVSAAASALGRAKGDRAAIKSKIIAIAKRKGWIASLPDAWQPQQKSLTSRLMEAARGLFRLAQTPDDMTSRDLEARLSEKLRELEGDAYVSFEAFWPVNDPTHVVYSCKTPSDSQPEPLPYPGYVNFDYDLYERPFELGDNGVVTFGPTRIEVSPVVRYEPVEGASPEGDYRVMAAELFALAGKRHSSSDETMIQSVHDQAVSLGATCAESRNAEAHECACRNRNLNQGEEHMDRTKTIAALAAHPHAAIKDPIALGKLDDATLMALQANVDSIDAALKVANDTAATAQVSLKAAQDALALPVTEDRLPTEYRTMMAERKSSDATEVAKLVVTLKAAQTVYTEEALKAKPLQELRDLAALLKVDQPVAQVVYARPVPRVAEAGRDFSAPDPYKAGLASRQQAGA